MDAFGITIHSVDDPLLTIEEPMDLPPEILLQNGKVLNSNPQSNGKTPNATNKENGFLKSPQVDGQAPSVAATVRSSR